jgi:putative transposase
VVKPSAKRKMYSYLFNKFNGGRRVICEVLQWSRSSSYRKSVKDDNEVEDKLRQLAKQYPTRGFDWYYLRIRSEGLVWNRKRVLRVYRKLGLVRRRKVKKRINRPYGEGLSQPIMPNITWSMDFMSDALEDSRKVRILNVIDDYNRQCLSIECGISMPSQRVTRILDELIELRGTPQSIRTDNGPEFTSHHYTDWCKAKGIKAKYIQAGKPNQNGYVERFNRTYREDILDAYIFESLSQLNIVSQKWQQQYNTEHHHQSLGGLTPIAFEYSRRKCIEAYESVKVKMNDELTLKPSQSSTLTDSSPSMLVC